GPGRGALRRRGDVHRRCRAGPTGPLRRRLSPDELRVRPTRGTVSAGHRSAAVTFTGPSRLQWNTHRHVHVDRGGRERAGGPGHRPDHPLPAARTEATRWLTDPCAVCASARTAWSPTRVS